MCGWKLLSLALLIVLVDGAVMAQTTTTYSSTGAKTPAGMQTGTPAGSFPLSGFDSINPFNGSLNFRLPLLRIGGRGTAGYTMTLPIEKKWRVEHTIYDPNVYCQACELFQVTHTYTPTDQPWGTSPGYGAGVLQGRRAGWESTPCGTFKVYTETLTRLTFTGPDGTQYELHDQLYDGKPRPGVCGGTFSSSRGTVFITADGTSATFISDTPIEDYSLIHDYPPFNVSGDLILRDGTRYHIEDGGVRWIRDRQGNRVTIGSQITDSLNRVVSFSYHNLPAGPYDEITYGGFAGVERHLRIYYASLSSRLRSGYSIQSYGVLFALGNNNTSVYDPLVVSSAELPNGQRYNFFYNSYGELARVELPTGGAFEYDYQTSDGVIDLGVWSSDPIGPVTEYEIYRRVTTKRIYGADGALESVIEFAGGPTGNNTEAQVTYRDSNGNWLAGEKHYYHGSALPILPQFTRPTDYSRWDEGKEYKTETLGGVNGPVLTRSEQTWQQQPRPWWGSSGSGAEPSNNPKVVTTVTTIEPASVNLVSKQTAINPQTGVVGFDQFNNQTDVWEFDYGVGAPSTQPVRHAHTDYLTINPVNSIDYTGTGVHLRSLSTAQQIYSVNPSSGVETLVAQSETKYDETALLPWYGTVQSWVDPGGTRGNPTSVRSWLNPGNSWIETRAQFDQVGNVSKSWDGNNNQTEVTYSANYHRAYPTQTKSAVPDPSGQFGSTTALVSSSVFDFWTGLVTATTDVNGQITEVSYSDLLDRPTQVRRVVGTSIANQTTFNYDDVNRTSTTTTDLNTYDDNVLVTKQLYDGLGRTIETRQYEGGTNYIAVKQIPFVVEQDPDTGVWARATQSSNPYRPYLGEQPVYTTTFLDALARVIKVRTPDNAIVKTVYTGNAVTVTDQIGKSRKSITDALGRLKQVLEDPNGLNYLTSYNYDVLGNLRQVTQDSQQRFFMYDSLSRLVRAKNPEQGNLTPDSDFPALTDSTSGVSNSSWSTAYKYDNNGNLAKRKDARNITATYAYDSVNRNITINYSDTATDPDVTRIYDTSSLGRGRLRESYAGGNDSIGANVEHVKIQSYDAMGRPKDQRQRFKTNGAWSTQEYQTLRDYNLAGGVKLQTYPSGRTVTSTYDSAGRTSSFTGNLGDTQRSYSTEIIYAPTGGMTKEKFGTDTPLYNKSLYNIRGQLAEIRVGTTYTSSGDTSWNRGAIINNYCAQCWGAWYPPAQGMPDNNGNLKSQQHFIPKEDQPQPTIFEIATQEYDYDNLNRLHSVKEGAMLRQEYVYDRFGNRRIETNPSLTFGGINNLGSEVETATNRLYAPGDLAIQDDASRRIRYDAVGNQTKDYYNLPGVNFVRTYDAENRMISATGSGVSPSVYTYNADGQRVRRKVDGVETWQIYGMDGELLAEYPANGATASPKKEYGYRNGQLLVTADAPSESAQNVSWANPSGVSISGNSLTQNAGFGYYYGASATQTLSGDGYLEFTASAAVDGNDYRFVGLSHISTNYWQSIDFCWRLDPDGTAKVCLGGYANGIQTNYGSGDKFRVGVEGGVIKFKKNGTTIYTAGAPTFPLYADASLWEVGATVNNAVMAQGAQNVTWTNPSGVSISGNSLTQNAGFGYYYGASATQTLSGDGYLEFTASAAVDGNDYRFVGLSHISTNYWQSIDFCWRLDPDGTAKVCLGGYANGIQTNYASGDKFRVEVEGGVIKFKKNGTTIYTAGAPTFPLYGDASLWEVGATVNNAVMASGGSPAQIHWLVADQLGTPRIILDKTGSLANVKRHDYLPFGEELYAGQGVRTAPLGYTSDSVRQKFTLKERDNETGLDYFLARYYANAQGRFTSVDPGNYQARENLADPQSWNAFSYASNNPLKRVDPTGKGWLDTLEMVLKVWWEKRQMEEQARATADEAQRRAEIRQFSEDQGLNGYVILSEADGSNTQAVSVDSLSRGQVFQISQTNRYLAAGIDVEGVRLIDHDDAVNLVTAIGGAITPGMPGSNVKDAVKTGRGLDKLSAEERESAAKFYEGASQRTTGPLKEPARLYNLERARYLREGGPVPPGTLRQFMARTGIQ